MALVNRKLEGEPDEVIHINGQPIFEFIEAPDLPANRRKLAVCSEHMDDGVFAAYTGDWLMGGCTFPGEGDDQILRFQHVCPGPGIIKDCRLRIDQFDAEGNKIGGFADSWRNLTNGLFPNPEDKSIAKRNLAAIAASTGVIAAGLVFRQLRKDS